MDEKYSPSNEVEGIEPQEVVLELARGSGFSGTVPNSLCFFPNGEDYCCILGGSVVCGNVNDPCSQLFLRGHKDYITCMDLSGSGNLLATGEANRNSDVFVWDMKEKQVIYKLEEHDGGITCAKFSRNERFLFTSGGDRDKMFVIWDTTTGMVVGKIPTLSHHITHIAWGEPVRDIKGRNTHCFHFATLNALNQIFIWSLDPSTGKCEGRQVKMGREKRTFTTLEFSIDGRWLYAGSTTGDVCVFLAKTAVYKRSIPTSQGGVTSLCIAPNEDVLVGTGEGRISHWIYEHQEYIEEKKLHVYGGVSTLRLSADSQLLLAGTSKGRISLVNCVTFEDKTVSDNHADAVTSLSFPPNTSNKFATISKDGTVVTWDLETMTIRARAEMKLTKPLCVVATSDMTMTGWEDGVIRAFDPDDGTLLFNIPNAHKSAVTCLGISDHEKFIVSAGKGGEIRVWELRSREMISHLKEHTSRVNAMAVYKDNCHVVTCSRDRSFYCWDLQKEQGIISRSQRMGGFHDIALSKDQTQVITVGQEKSVSFWDLREASPVVILGDAHQGEALSVAVSNDGKLFATGGTDHVVKLWDFETKQCLFDGIAHTGQVNSLSFSHDDSLLVSAGDDGAIFVWNVIRL